MRRGRWRCSAAGAAAGFPTRFRTPDFVPGLRERIKTGQSIQRLPVALWFVCLCWLLGC
jgi:hypothetical protein